MITNMSLEDKQIMELVEGIKQSNQGEVPMEIDVSLAQSPEEVLPDLKEDGEDMMEEDLEAEDKEGSSEKGEVQINFTEIASSLIESKFMKKQKRNIWEGSKWFHISELENDDVGGVGEQIIGNFCSLSGIEASIDGLKTKQMGGGVGDGIIMGKTCEIKTARLGSSGGSFQHELGEVPWKADYMIFLDISPQTMYVTIFKNFSEEFYQLSGRDSKIKCVPVFPTKSITWRKHKGAFKLDTSLGINEKNKFTFKINDDITDISSFREFVSSIIN